MERDDVGGRKESRKRRVGEVKRAGELVASAHIKADDIHTEAIRHPNNVSADVPAADNAERLAGEVKAAEPPRREGAGLAHALVGVNDMPRQGEEEPEGEFGDGVLAVGGDIRYRNTTRSRRSEVDVVKAGGAGGDELHLGKSLQLLFAYLGLYKGTEYFCLCVGEVRERGEGARMESDVFTRQFRPHVCLLPRLPRKVMDVHIGYRFIFHQLSQPYCHHNILPNKPAQLQIYHQP